MQNNEVLVEDYIQTIRQKHQIKRSKWLPHGTVPVISQGREFISGYINDTEGIYDGDLPVIVFGEHTCTLKYVDFLFAIGANGTRLIRPKTSDFDIRYLYYSLRNLPLEPYGYQAHFKYLKTSKISCPPMPVQHKIAAILGNYDDLIANNIRRIDILEEMARILYREWFVRFRFPGHENVKMVDSELGRIPQGWEIRELGDLAASIRQHVKPSQADPRTPYLDLSHFPRKSIALSKWDVVDGVKSTSLRFKKGEILFGKIRPYFHKVGVAPLDGICSPSTIVIRSLKNEWFSIVLASVSSAHFIDYATTVSQGGTMPSVDWKVLVKYPIVIPPLQLARQFNKLVQDKVDNIHNLIFRNRNLRQTRDLLLPRLISGEINVSELDIKTNGIQ